MRPVEMPDRGDLTSGASDTLNPVLRFELGRRVPEDVPVVGYDDVPKAVAKAYHLTTVRLRSRPGS